LKSGNSSKGFHHEVNKGGKMKKVFYFISVVCLLFVSVQGAFGYLGKSIRIMGFGEELAGVIQDEYTDIYRNPAYLSFVEKAKVFGQYNLYWHPEVKIAEFFRNQKTGMAGVVLPLSGYGNLALIGELKPSTTKDGSTIGSRHDYDTYYTIDSSSTKRYSKDTIRNFKLIYGLKVSPSLSLGMDFAYLKNYNEGDSMNKGMTAQRYSDSENLKSYRRDDRVDDYDTSPDAQRGSLGMVLTPSQKTNVDFTLYYENLTYTSKSSTKKELEEKWLGTDTLWSETFAYTTCKAPVKYRAVGLDANFKYHFPQKTSLTILLGGRYQKNELSRLSQNNDSTYSSPNYISISNNKTFLQHKNRFYSFVMGVGAEKDFSPAIKVGVALKGYWESGKLDQEEWQKSSWRSLRNDSLINSISYFRENRVNKTTNFYKLTFPIGTEIVLHKMIKARIGGELTVTRKETETGYSTHSEAFYSQGFGFSYNDRILMDVYIKDEITPIGNWMAKVEYRF
jgi:hypothetical protein